MRCPECDRNLAPIAETCRCGWKKHADTPGRPHVPCAYETCGSAAIIRESNANLCYFHMMQHAQERGLAAMKREGLERWPDETFAEHKRRVFDYIKLMARTSKMSKPLEDAA